MGSYVVFDKFKDVLVSAKMFLDMVDAVENSGTESNDNGIVHITNLTDVEHGYMIPYPYTDSVLSELGECSFGEYVEQLNNRLGPYLHNFIDQATVDMIDNDPTIRVIVHVTTGKIIPFGLNSKIDTFETLLIPEIKDISAIGMYYHFVSKSLVEVSKINESLKPYSDFYVAGTSFPFEQFIGLDIEGLLEDMMDDFMSGVKVIVTL